MGKRANLDNIWISHSNGCHYVLLKFPDCLDASLKKIQKLIKEIMLDIGSTPEKELFALHVIE